jgi:hypothetical protein
LQEARSGGRSRYRPQVRARLRRAGAPGSSGADNEGWVVTWLCGIGTGTSWYAKWTWSCGTKAARGTRRIASSTRGSSTPVRRAAVTREDHGPCGKLQMIPLWLSRHHVTSKSSGALAIDSSWLSHRMSSTSPRRRNWCDSSAATPLPSPLRRLDGRMTLRRSARPAAPPARDRVPSAATKDDPELSAEVLGQDQHVSTTVSPPSAATRSR